MSVNRSHEPGRNNEADTLLQLQPALFVFEFVFDDTPPNCMATTMRPVLLPVVVGHQKVVTFIISTPRGHDHCMCPINLTQRTIGTILVGVHSWHSQSPGNAAGFYSTDIHMNNEFLEKIVLFNNIVNHSSALLQE